MTHELKMNVPIKIYPLSGMIVKRCWCPNWDHQLKECIFELILYISYNQIAEFSNFLIYYSFKYILRIDNAIGE